MYRQSQLLISEQKSNRRGESETVKAGAAKIRGELGEELKGDLSHEDGTGKIGRVQKPPRLFSRSPFTDDPNNS
jgi:hypothetical protein